MGVDYVEHRASHLTKLDTNFANTEVLNKTPPPTQWQRLITLISSIKIELKEKGDKKRGRDRNIQTEKEIDSWRNKTTIKV